MRIPTTGTLHAFQVAARTGSFKLAARELCLTASAVSYRVKALEEALGLALFRRGTREVTLTDAGTAYLHEIELLFRRLEGATGDVMSQFRSRAVLLRVAPFFASEFLLPRLADLRASLAGVDIRIHTDGSSEHRLGAADVSIVLGRGPWADVEAIRLLRQSYVPACAPALLERDPIHSVDELNEHVLLVHKAHGDTWRQWAEAAGLAIPRPRQEIWFDTMTELVYAAESGVGVGLIPVPLALRRLNGRSLVAVFDQRLESAESYHLLHRSRGAMRAEVAQFRDWILRQLAPVGAAMPRRRARPETLRSSVTGA